MNSALEASGTFKLFINGEQVAETKNAKRALQVKQGQGFYMGSHAAGEASFVGSLARVAVWSSADENLVLAGRTLKLIGSEPDLMAYFPLSRDSLKPVAPPLAQGATKEERERYIGKIIATRREASNLVAGGTPAVVMPSTMYNEILRDRELEKEREKLMKSVSADLSWTKDKNLLASGMFPTFVDDELMKASDAEGEIRAKQVKAAMERSWASYKRFAWGRDELKPRGGVGVDVWGSMGTTLVDSLDTLWLMGMREEFEEARDWVRDKLSFDKPAQVSVFETCIRSLGGLNAAYDLSGDEAFLVSLHYQSISFDCSSSRFTAPCDN